MMTTVAENLKNPPFLRIRDIDGPTDPGRIRPIDPPLAAPAIKVKFSPTKSKLAVASNVRKDALAGIGDPNEPTPTAGIRVFSRDDTMLLFGGVGGQPMKLYRRAGPFLAPHDFAIEDGQFFTTADFSEPDGALSKLAAVQSGDTTTIKVWNISAGTFSSGPEIDAGELVTKVEFVGPYLVAQKSESFTLYDRSSLEPHGTANGTILSWSSVNGSLHFACRQSSGQSAPVTIVNEAFEVVFSGVAGAASGRVAYAPDGTVLLTAIPNTQNGAYSTVYTAVQRDGETYIVGPSEETADEWNASNFSFDQDETGYQVRETGTGSSLRKFTPAEEEVMSRIGAQDIAMVERTSSPPATPLPNGRFARNTTSSDPEVWVYGTNDGTVSLEDQWPLLPDGENGYMNLFGYTRDGAYAVMGRNRNLLIRNVNTGERWAFQPSSGAAFRNHRRLDSVKLPTGEYRFPVLASGYSGTGKGHLDVLDFNPSSGNLTVFQSIAFSIPSDTSDFQAIMSPDGMNIQIIINRNSGQTYYTPYQYVFDGATYNAVTSGIKIVTDWYWQWTGNNIYFQRSTRVYENGQNVYYPQLYRSKYDPISKSFSEPQPIDLFQGSQYIRWTVFPHEEILVTGFGESGVLAQFWRFIDGAWKEVARTAPLARSSFRDAVALDNGKVAVFTGATVGDEEECYLLEYEPPYTVQTYKMSEAITLPVTMRNTIRIAPSGQLLHDDGSNHIQLLDPPEVAETLAFETDFPANQVRDVLYSHSGNAVTAYTPDGATGALKPGGGGSFVNFKRMEGLFISLYDDVGNAYKEGDFVMHSIDTVVTNLVFGLTPKWFSYFATSTADPKPADAGDGRYVYDVSSTGLVELHYYEYEVGRDASFAEFNPEENRFAATYRYSDGRPSIVSHYYL